MVEMSALTGSAQGLTAPTPILLTHTSHNSKQIDQELYWVRQLLVNSRRGKGHVDDVKDGWWTAKLPTPWQGQHYTHTLNKTIHFTQQLQKYYKNTQKPKMKVSNKLIDWYLVSKMRDMH